MAATPAVNATIRQFHVRSTNTDTSLDEIAATSTEPETEIVLAFVGDVDVRQRRLDDGPARYPAGNPNSLMTPQIGAREAIHDPGPITRGIFEDIGWSVGPTTPTAPANLRVVP